MPPLRVTALTQQRRPPGEQRRMHGTVGFMAQRAVFAYRRVVKQHRPAILGMAVQTELVRRVSFQQRIGNGFVRAVAVSTDHGIETDRMSGWLHAVRALAAVTVEADRCLLRLQADRIPLAV